MRQGAMTRRFTAPLALLAVLLVTPTADAASLAGQCRQVCADEIAACVAAGGRHLACKRQTLRRCRREGLAVCQGTVAGGNIVAVTSPLRVPTSLTATPKTSGEIDLSWRDTNSQGSGYLIERTLDPASGFVQIGAVGVNVRTYKDLGLTQRTTHYYQVRAFGSTNPASGVTDAFSAYSNIASATTKADTRAPSVPSGLRALASSCDQINLSWTASTDNGSGVQGYKVYRGGVFLKQVLAPATSTTDAGLLPSTTYSYAVSAVDRALTVPVKSSGPTRPPPPPLRLPSTRRPRRRPRPPRRPPPPSPGAATARPSSPRRAEPSAARRAVRTCRQAAAPTREARPSRSSSGHRRSRAPRRSRRAGAARTSTPSSTCEAACAVAAPRSPRDATTTPAPTRLARTPLPGLRRP